MAAVFLIAAAPVAADEVTILALGDSLTQGYGLAEADGFVPQMQDWLWRNGVEARLINGGVSGDTTAGGAARADWSLTPDIDAMIVNLGANDMLRGLAPDQARTNLGTILSAAQAKSVEVLLVGLPAPGNYGPDYKADFDRAYAELSEQYGTLHFPNFLIGLGSDDPADLQAYFQPDRIHPNTEGVKRIVGAMGPMVLQLVQTVHANAAQ